MKLKKLIAKYNSRTGPAQSPEEYETRQKQWEEIRKLISKMDGSFMHKEAICPQPPLRGYMTQAEKEMTEMDNELKEL